MLLKIDIHVHTAYSPDSLIRPEEIAHYAHRRGLDGVAVTDHDRLDSGLRMAKEKEFLILPGMEITSSDGHILALNVREPVPKGLAVEETLDKIHSAGGITVACHPAAMFKGSLGNHTTSKFDAVEVVNSSAIPFAYSVKRGEQIAHCLGIPRVAGSDAHYGPEIGYAYTLVDAEPNADDIVNAIRTNRCRPFGTAIPLPIRLKREMSILSKRFSFKEERRKT